MYLDFGGKSQDDVLWDLIRRTGSEAKLQSAFQVTRPLWNGFWIDSPLNRQQCLFLHELLAKVDEEMPRNRDRLQEFLAALDHAIKTGEPLNVSLAPPGHVDLGWSTTFVHCPRCKAEGPVERWQHRYTDVPITCPTCGCSYSPAATYSCERDYFAESVACTECGASTRIKDFPQEDIRKLEDHHYYHSFSEEMAWLRRVASFYKRHPDAKIKSHFTRVTESNDPKIRAMILDCVPFDEIELPADSVPTKPTDDWSIEDLEVADYLRHNEFSLPGRMTFVAESIERLEPIVATQSVLCPACHKRLI
jgi:hypothetical protein